MKKLTTLETTLLQEIKNMFDEQDNLCFTREVTQQEKGVLSSLVKKGLIYNSFEGMEFIGNGYEKHNYFPVN